MIARRGPSVGPSPDAYYNPAMRIPWRGVAALAASLLVSLSAHATQWIVAQDGSGSFRTIQGALDAASYGDFIYVSPGVYDERVELKDGVRVVGAGQASTVIRNAYGFDDVVHLEHMSTGSLEKVTVERMASVLAGPAVSAVSAGGSLIDCTILGGQGAGVEAEGDACSLRLERASVSGNDGHGVYVHDRASVAISDSRIEENAGAGLFVAASSTAQVSSTALSDNGRSAIVVEGDGSLGLEDANLARHPEWGIVALGPARLALRNVDISDCASGAFALAGSARAEAASLAVRGGAEGIILSGNAALAADTVQVRGVVGNAVQVRDSASLDAERLEVAGAGRDGVVFATTGGARLERATVVDCAGDGIHIEAGRAEVRASILAYNRGAGVRLDVAASPPPTADLAYNTVWANGVDYAGTARPSTDLAASPELADYNGRLLLLPDSPCLRSGPAWTAVGAGTGVDDLAPITLEFSPRLAGGAGLEWTSTLRIAGLPLELETLSVGAEWTGSGGRAGVDVSLLGTWGFRLALRADGASRWDSTTGTGYLALAYGADGTLDVARSWAAAWIEAEAVAGGLYAGGRLSVASPSGPWTGDLSLGLGGPIPIRAAVGFADFTLRSFELRAPWDIALDAGTLRVDARVALFPLWQVSAEASWSHGGSLWQGTVAYLPTEQALLLSVTLGDAAARVEAEARLVAGLPVDGDLSLSIGGPSFRVRAGLGLGSSGAQLRAGLDASFGGGSRAAANQPPVPAFRTTPPDPEVGKPVRFIAGDSTDADGEIREIWWDFGDGAAAEGESVEHAYAAAGPVDVTLTVADDDGATASLTQALKIWPADTTPLATFVAYPVSPGGVRLPRPLRVGDLVRLDASESADADGSIVEYAWDLGADGVFDVTTSAAAVTVDPLAAGSHPITLRVIDDTGRSDAVMQVVLVDKSEPPQAQFSFSPPTPAVQDPVYFADRSADADGAIAVREWDFGDGTMSREAAPTHRYPREGDFTVTLRVTDDAGLASSIAQTVRVSTTPEIADVGDVWAVVIGVSDYAEVKDLQYATDDAIAVARWLLDSGVAADHIRLLLDREGPQAELDGLQARRATLVNVREALGWLRRVSKPDDLVLVHFSGHGFQGPDDDGDENDGLDEFFILWDTLNAAKEDTALRDDEFGDALDRIESQHVVIFFDGCYSGGLSRSLPPSARPVSDRPDLFSDFSVEGRLVFSASAEAQDAFESDQLRHGIFTYYLVDGLRGAADANGDRRVTAWELYEYVAATVPARAELERGAAQNPQLLGEGDVRVLLAEAASPPAADFSYQPPVPFAGGRVSFTDESTADRPIVTRAWAFGDGAASSEANPEHTFAQPGDYTVELRAATANGLEGRATHVVTIADPGRVLSADPADRTVVLSVGRDNGVVIGDRFEVSSGASSEGEAAQLEITEILDGRMSAARIADGPIPQPDARVFPAPSS